MILDHPAGRWKAGQAFVNVHENRKVPMNQARPIDNEGLNDG